MKFTYPFKNPKIQSSSSSHTTKIQRSKTKTNQTHSLCNPKKPTTMSPTHSLPLLLLISLLLISTSTSSSNSKRVSELQSLKSRSKTSIIHLDDHSVSLCLTSTKTPRPYYLPSSSMPPSSTTSWIEKLELETEKQRESSERVRDKEMFRKSKGVNRMREKNNQILKKMTWQPPISWRKTLVLCQA